MAKSGVLSQRITTSHAQHHAYRRRQRTWCRAPRHQRGSAAALFRSGIVVSILKEKWEPITGDDLEKAAGKVVRPRDVVIVNTGWHKFYEDSEDYFCRRPRFVPSAV